MTLCDVVPTLLRLSDIGCCESSIVLSVSETGAPELDPALLESVPTSV